MRREVKAFTRSLISEVDSSCFTIQFLISLLVSSCLSRRSLTASFSFLSSFRVSSTRDVEAEGAAESEWALPWMSSELALQQKFLQQMYQRIVEREPKPECYPLHLLMYPEVLMVTVTLRSTPTNKYRKYQSFQKLFFKQIKQGATLST